MCKSIYLKSVSSFTKIYMPGMRWQSATEWAFLDDALRFFMFSSALLDATLIPSSYQLQTWWQSIVVSLFATSSVGTHVGYPNFGWENACWYVLCQLEKTSQNISKQVLIFSNGFAHAQTFLSSVNSLKKIYH